MKKSRGPLGAELGVQVPRTLDLGPQRYGQVRVRHLQCAVAQQHGHLHDTPDGRQLAWALLHHRQERGLVGHVGAVGPSQGATGRGLLDDLAGLAVEAPDLDRKAMLRAPHATSSSTRLLLRPPRPPTMRQVPPASSLRESLARAPFGNDGASLPRCLPRCMVRKADSISPTGYAVGGSVLAAHPCAWGRTCPAGSGRQCPCGRGSHWSGR